MLHGGGRSLVQGAKSAGEIIEYIAKNWNVSNPNLLLSFPLKYIYSSGVYIYLYIDVQEHS